MWVYPHRREDDDTLTPTDDRGHATARLLKQHINISTAQRIFRRAKAKVGIDKVGGIHSLRHAYATHQLENGLPLHQLQRLLGHQNLRSTMCYVHWVPGEQPGAQGHADLVGTLAVNHG
jgi:integrase/recombinase XerD